MLFPNPSPLCFGCEALGGTDWGESDISEIERAVKRAVSIGINFFDTAAIYGLSESEKRLAKALGNKKHDVVIATKGGLSWSTKNVGRAKVWKDSSPSAIKTGVYGSLKRMGLDVIPIYFVHWPDINTSFESTFSTLQRLKEDGLIQALGCSNFSNVQLAEALKFADIKYVQGPLNLFMKNRHSETLAFCRKKGLHFVAYNVLGSGMLTGKYDKNTVFPNNDRRSRLDSFKDEEFLIKLEECDLYKSEALKLKMSLHQYALNWVISQPSVISIITGIKSVDQLIMNWSAIKKEVF